MKFEVGNFGISRLQDEHILISTAVWRPNVYPYSVQNAARNQSAASAYEVNRRHHLDSISVTRHRREVGALALRRW